MQAGSQDLGLGTTEVVGHAVDLDDAVERAIAYVSEVAADSELEVQAQRAAGALYHATSAAVMAFEGDRLARQNGGSTRLSLAELVLECRLSAQDPLASHGAPTDETLLSLLADSCNSL